MVCPAPGALLRLGRKQWRPVPRIGIASAPVDPKPHFCIIGVPGGTSCASFPDRAWVSLRVVAVLREAIAGIREMHRPMVSRLAVSTQAHEQLVDVTARVQAAVSEAGLQSGVVTLFVPHTTAAVTINENADPSVAQDILKGLMELVPRAAEYYRHLEGNSDAHIKATLVGPSVQVLVEGGKLVLGTWQGIYLCEFDGPRERKLWVKMSAD